MTQPMHAQGSDASTYELHNPRTPQNINAMKADSGGPCLNPAAPSGTAEHWGVMYAVDVDSNPSETYVQAPSAYRDFVNARLGPAAPPITGFLLDGDGDEDPISITDDGFFYSIHVDFSDSPGFTVPIVPVGLADDFLASIGVGGGTVTVVLGGRQGVSREIEEGEEEMMVLLPNLGTSIDFRAQSDGVPNARNVEAQFGYALSVTQANGDQFDDLVIGARQEAAFGASGVDPAVGQGAVSFVLGGRGGISPSPLLLRQGKDGIPDLPEGITRWSESGDLQSYIGIGLGDFFGSAVGGTSNGLLAIGAPGEEAEGGGWVDDHGWAALVGMDRGSESVAVTAVRHRVDSDFGVASRLGTHFGAAVTQPRTALRYAEPRAPFDLTLIEGGGVLTTVSQRLPNGSFEPGEPAWTTQGPSITLTGDAFSHGGTGLRISGNGVVGSAPFATTSLESVGRRIAFDVQPEGSAPLTGASVTLRLTVPSLRMYDLPLGTAELEDTPSGEFTSFAFPLDDAVRSVLLGAHSSATLELAVQGLPGGNAVVVDYIRFLDDLVSSPGASCKHHALYGRDYFSCENASTWDAGRQQCFDVDLDLATITNSQENAFLTPLVPLQAFIGGTDGNQEGAWRWASSGDQFWSGTFIGQSVGGRYSSWDLFQPNDFLGQDCAQLEFTGKWDDEACAFPSAFLCESPVDACPTDPMKDAPGACGCNVSDMDADGDGIPSCIDGCPADATRTVPGDCGCANTPAPVGTACEDGLCAAATTCGGSAICGTASTCAAPDTACRIVRNGNHDYWFCNKNRSWSAAAARCAAVGTHLVTIDDAAGDAFVAANAGRNVYIGANDATVEGNWVWTQGNEAFWEGGALGGALFGQYANWDLLQPAKGLLIDRDCAAKVWIGGKWQTWTCGTAEAYVCER